MWRLALCELAYVCWLAQRQSPHMYITGTLLCCLANSHGATWPESARLVHSHQDMHPSRKLHPWPVIMEVHQSTRMRRGLGLSSSAQQPPQAGVIHSQRAPAQQSSRAPPGVPVAWAQVRVGAIRQPSTPFDAAQLACYRLCHPSSHSASHLNPTRWQLPPVRPAQTRSQVHICSMRHMVRGSNTASTIFTTLAPAVAALALLRRIMVATSCVTAAALGAATSGLTPAACASGWAWARRSTRHACASTLFQHIFHIDPIPVHH